MNPADIKLEYDQKFINFLIQEKISLLVSSYKSSTVLCIGTTMQHDINKIIYNTKLSVELCTFKRPTGMYYNNSTLWIGTQFQLSEFKDIGFTKYNGNCTDYDCTFVQRKSYVTGDIDTHDITINSEGKLYFIGTKCNAVCTISDNGYNIKIHWKPSWISSIVFEDRCHLNGLCSRNGIPRYITSVSTSDIISGWRENRFSGGIVYDIVYEKVLCTDLSMPHSPRWANDRLYLLEAGTGYFGYIDIENKSSEFKKLTFIPGFIRGLSIIKNKYALICSSLDRHETIFQDISLGNQLQLNNAEAKCGIFVVCLDTNKIISHLYFKTEPKELYDVIVIPDKMRPIIVSMDEINFPLISISAE